MTARLPDPQRSRALLVGVSSYDELHDLPAVSRDLDDLHAVLTSPEGTGLPAEHCEVLRDPKDETEVGTALARAAAEAEDVLFVYYAGHGLISGADNKLYLATKGTKEQTVSTSALPCTEVRQAIRTSRAKARVLVVDCCFSGRAIEQTMSGRAEVVFAGVDVEGAYILTATADSQTSQAPEGATHTLFTGALLTALRDGVPGAGPLVTLGALAGWLKDEMAKQSGPTPRNRDDGSVSELALAPNQAGRVLAVRAGRDRAEERLQALAKAEVDAESEFQVVRDKIVTTDRPPGRPASAGLRERLDRLDELTGAGHWAGAGDELTALHRDIEAAGEALAERLARMSGLLERREELRGRLSIYLAMAVRLGIAEHDEVSTRHTAARELLWTKPCDLRAATMAVAAYQKSVVQQRERPR
ncbi:caspase family protein [Amycolatopsis nigrescens]|uniref:caspase family protein n=1 Tax=Amycolatopsis nigrescens TaxID=381445 RepID=UPI0003A513D9|nr:caspase family protein [Amycolatopsis nigrescens]